MSETTGQRWTVGELARRSGVTVRTLHHYDAIGLLRPGGRSESGYRHYGPADVERLYRIRSLRQLGLSLGEIVEALAACSDGLLAAARRHLDLVERQQLLTEQLRRRLGQLLVAGEQARSATTEDVLATLEVMSVFDTTAQKTIPILVYADLDQAHDYLVRVFGLQPGGVERDSHGRAVHGRVFAGDESEIWLHPESAAHGLASPAATTTACNGVVVIVDDVDAHHRHTVGCGARIEYPPVDQPYGLREYGAYDAEGGHWYFSTPIGP